MGSLNKDTFAALFLLAVTAAFFWETFSIPELGYASMGSDVWPRIILVPLFGLCVLYLIQSLRRAPSAEESSDEAGSGGFIAGVYKYRNPIMCFVLFLVFLLTVDYLGLLIGGIGLTFALLTALGNRTPKALAMHVLISVTAVGLVWSLFTFVLRVYLPEGELLRIY